MSLAKYRKKRNFSQTPEPRGRADRKTGPKLRYIIQKHDASRLHYDFRLELDGVLKSWAVPKGPSLDPERKVLAVQVEDHPLDYGGFEGVIPKGQYGGGTVLLWDEGTWQPLIDPAPGLKDGKLHFVLNGKKLHGEWSLVRMGGKAGDGGKNWLLMKLKDKYAQTRGDILVGAPQSVKTSRSLEQIAGATPSARNKRVSPPLAAPADSILTHPDKILYPDAGITKRGLAQYYCDVQQWMLPHVVDRPLALVRCPAGLSSKCFFQRNWSSTLPPAIGKVNIGKGKTKDFHVAVHDLAGIISLVQMGVLEIHTWNCASENTQRPDQLVFDLDPGSDVPWNRIVEGTVALNRTLTSLDLPTFLKTSGGKGLHITIPIQPSIEWDSAKQFCETIAKSLAQKSNLFVANMRKDLRGGKIYIDYNRNSRSATAVAPYSTRARPGAAIAMPISWEELGKLKSADHFTVETASRYLDRRQLDPWRDFQRSRVDLRKLVSRKSAA